MERVTQILASDHLNVPKEELVFEAAMLWLDKCPTRRQNFETVSYFSVSNSQIDQELNTMAKK